MSAKIIHQLDRKGQRSARALACRRESCMSDTIDVLLIDASPEADQFWQPLLKPGARETFRVQGVRNVDEALALLPQTLFDSILFDFNYPNAKQEIIRIRACAPEAPIIIVAMRADEEHAHLLGEQLGAQDFLVREDISRPLLTRSIRYASEKKRAQNAIARAEEKFRSLFENTVEGIFQTSPKGTYINANTALARIYGYESSAELKSKLTNIAHELYVEHGRRDEFIRKMEEHDVVTNFESRIYRKDGTVIWISENVRAVRDDKGTLLHYEGTVEDITEKKIAEQKIKDSETLYHSLVENLPQHIFRKDLSERFTFANTRFCQTLGKPLDEILGKTDFDFYPPELATKYQKDDQLIMETGKMFETIEENQPPGGEKIYVQVVKTPLYSASGEIIGLQCIFWDITEKRRAEEKVRRTTLELAQSREELRAKNQQMEEDLRMARDIQEAMIPSTYPCFPRNATPETSSFRFQHVYIPTGAVGGDFFNILPLSDTKVGLFICDVMGHGVRSALVTAILRALVEELTRLASDPGQLLTQINRDLRAILQQQGSPLYTTAFYMVADLETKQITYANAGHPKPILLRRDTGDAVFLRNNDTKSHPALGLFPNATYPSSSCTLREHDVVLLFTDGAYDVEHDGEILSPDWLRDQIKTRARMPIKSAFDEILAELKKLNGPGEFTDDVCLVAMEVARCDS
jgi:sigma-B regulation protein RsbU (phosphoserine phosphatase)